jgi:glycosyltransferase involved in cell wall biosynthesis
VRLRAARQLAQQPPPSVGRVTDAVRPFWSVMIPCWNNAALLEKALRSVLDQDPGSDEMQIEVLDDASTLDDPAAVVERVGKGRVDFYRQPANVGAPRNFTTCARRAKGRWVHILHGDDMVAPGFYEQYRAHIESCPDVMMVASRIAIVDVDGRQLEVSGTVRTANGYMVDAALTIARDNPVRFVSVVVAREAYERLGGFRPELVHANDWEMWVRQARHGAVGWVDEVLGLYRSHPGSDTTRLHRSTAYLDDCLAAAEVIASHFELDPILQKQVRRAARRTVCEYALKVAERMLDAGELRLTAANAARAMTIDRCADVRHRALPMLRTAVIRRLLG